MELQIDDVAFGGKGVGRLNGKAVFVPFVIEGEKIAARITREKKHFAEAELERVLEPAPQRVEAECPYFGRCGGCSYQHMNYEHQLAVKQRQVEQIMRRIGHFTDLPMRPIIPSPLPYEYRNRITVHCEEGVVGYYRRDAHRLIDVERCPIARPEVNAALRELRSRRPRDGHYTLRAGDGPRIFSQTNDEVAESLAKLIASWILLDQELLIDAFCGAGFFTKRLRNKFARVVGIEWDRFAVAAAEKDAASNESYLADDVELELEKQLRDANLMKATVIVDPPATGLSAVIRGVLTDRAPATLIYVSCNPATLARDLSELQKNFSIESITPLDMFPQTAEIEVAVHLRRRSA
ncbi:MAG: TRAM domain-containing protein [Verrucomicrobiota bacterium]|nr:TRAM domain-containing protein [Verrucomicrobiota bacterium]MDQ6938571.1 TRAM domain-containing protein [Verrucomicrobiota bacterium]